MNEEIAKLGDQMKRSIQRAAFALAKNEVRRASAELSTPETLRAVREWDQLPRHERCVARAYRRSSQRPYMLVGEYRVYGVGEKTRSMLVMHRSGEGGDFPRDDIEAILEDQEPWRSNWLHAYFAQNF